LINQIHPTAIVDDSVTLGSDNVIGPFAVVMGKVSIGDHNWIGPHVVIGAPAEHSDFHAPGQPPVNVEGTTRIGSRCIIHEHVAIQAPTVSNTSVGDEAYLMHGMHIGHDVTLEDGVTISPMAGIGGGVFIGSKATIGMGAIIHQHLLVGQLCMVGMNSTVTRSISPFSLVAGSPARFMRANAVGLERAGIQPGPWIDEIPKSFAEWDYDLFPPALIEYIKSYRDRLNP
jgi:UDP-N-acetylglucosamine acyltransferase